MSLPKIYYVSDLHDDLNKHYYRKFYPADAAQSIVVVAGDINTGLGGVSVHQKFRSVVGWYARRYLAVVVVPGNHDFYGNLLNTQISDLKQQISTLGLRNIYFLTHDMGGVDIHGYTFFGDTFWSNLHLIYNSPLAVWDLGRHIADFRNIRFQPPGEEIRLWTPDDMMLYNKKASKSLFAFVDSDAPNKIVVTHFSPSMQSMDEKYMLSPCNDYFHNNLDHLIENSDIKLWIHGHTHTSKNYFIGNTNIVCNALGHITHNEITGFDPSRYY